MHSWNTKLAAIWSATWLSQKRDVGLKLWAVKSFNRCCKHVISQVVVAIAWYSTSVVDLETVSCFFDSQEINDEPRNTQKLVMDFMVSYMLPNQHHRMPLVENHVLSVSKHMISNCKMSIQRISNKLTQNFYWKW